MYVCMYLGRLGRDALREVDGGLEDREVVEELGLAVEQRIAEGADGLHSGHPFEQLGAEGRCEGRDLQERRQYEQSEQLRK